MKAVNVRVTGRVQGVAFRWSAQAEALRLGVTGWVRNEPDGSVLLYVEGPDDSVDALVAWCRQGPPSARVRAVAVAPAPAEGGSTFRVDY
jgi:acylphosphatase